MSVNTTRAVHRIGSIATATAVVAALALAGCANDVGGECAPLQTTPGPTMRPGDNCLRCHQDGFGDDEAPAFTAAGTVFPSVDSQHCEGVEGVKVFLMGANGEEVELTTNAAGNFWTREPLMEEGPGPRIEFEGRTQQMARYLPVTPACNACHSNPPVGGAPGKIFAP